MGGEVGGELDVFELGEILIFILDGKFVWDFLVYWKVEFLFFLVRYFLRGGEFGGEFDVELFCDLGDNFVVKMGLRLVVFILLNGLVWLEFNCILIGEFVCNDVFGNVNRKWRLD